MRALVFLLLPRAQVIFCVGLGLFSGAASTFFYQLVRWETFKTDPLAFVEGNPTRAPGSFLHTLESSGLKVSSLIGAYAFFPTFLQMGYVVYAVGRWRGFQETGFYIIGKLNNTALLVGSAVKDRHCVAAKHLCYRVWRYLTVVHILCYRALDSNGWFAALTVEDLVKNGLLTEEEAELLPAADNTMHDVVISWISDEMFAGTRLVLIHMGTMREKCSENLLSLRIFWV